MKLNTGTLDDFEYPSVLYKYRDWDCKFHKRFITNREVYMASPIQFEDKLDCKIPIRYDLMTSEQAHKFYDRLARQAEPLLSRQQRRNEVRKRVKTADYKNPQKNKEYQDFYFQEYFQRLGVLSLTAERCLDDMWNKYANEHRGFCIGYNSRILFEYLGGGGKVTYDNNLPILLPDPIMSRTEARIGQVFSKEQKWDFEKEYRTHKFWINGATVDDRRIQLPKDAFSCVILGKNFKEKDRKDIIQEVNKFIGGIEVIEYNSICSP